MENAVLILKENSWYGWQMLPGYEGEHCVPYFSPILMHEVIPKKSSKNIVKLLFGNALYAQGCQDFEVDMKVVTRAEKYLVGELLPPKGSITRRAAVICEIEFEWVKRFCPGIISAYPVERCTSLAQSSVTTYLNEVFNVRAL